ncbi:MAG: helix-turn-helix transcriptional regulator [Rhodospirillales bacterium]|jgi:XRE family aerobic/anaerobic benzoate catabolism transcriptional regulator
MAEITNFRGETVSSELGSHLEYEGKALLQRVGERVRKARSLKGLSRRVLSENSGVSPRYIAQLEAGEGNISIGLLQRVAISLDHRIEWLVGEEDPWTSDVMRIADLYRLATAETRQKALDVLSPLPPETLRAHRICLIGLRGAGKSTLGAMAGQALGVPFVELNREIEDHSGMPVKEIIALYGPEGYRTHEAQAMGRIIATHDTLILAVAGGIVAEPNAYKMLLSHFHTVWVKARPEDHMSRVLAQGDTRPMQDRPEAMEQLKSILASREPLYEHATVRLDTSGKPLQTSVDELVTLIREHGFLDEM